MAQVKVITARFGRKRQPAQYESAEAMIEFTISAEEDGQMGNISVEQVGMGEALLGIAKDLVLRELGVIKAGETASAAKLAAAAGTKEEAPAAAPAASGKRGGGKKKDAEAPAAPAAPAAPTGRQISDNPDDRKPVDDDIPGEGESKPAAATAADNPDLPDETPTPPAGAEATAVTITTQELHAFIAGEIKEKRLDHATVKAVSGKFNVARIADLKLDQLGPYKAALDAEIKKLGSNPDISDL